MIDSPLKDIRIGKLTSQWAAAQGIECKYFESTESTNDFAKKEAFSDKIAEHALLLYLADEQTKGRGRGKNTWTTETGTSLLSSWSFLLQDLPQPLTAPRMGLAVYKALTATWPYLNFSIKAPNDIYLGPKKLGGLLIETISQGEDVRLIIGLGLNVIASPEIDAPTISIAEALPEHAPLLGEDWIGFLERLIFEITNAIAKSQDDLNTTEAASLVFALNQNPNQQDQVIEIDELGNMKTKTKTISWTEL